MKARVVSNWRTTLFGTVLLIVSVFMVLMKFISGGEFIALIPTIVGLLCAPDSMLKRDNFGTRDGIRDTGHGTRDENFGTRDKNVKRKS